MTSSLIFAMCALFGLVQVLMARRSRRYSEMLDRDDFLFQRRQVARGVRRNASLMIALGLLFSAVPLLLAFHTQAVASADPAPGERHSMRLAESLACVPSNPADRVCSTPE